MYREKWMFIMTIITQNINTKCGQDTEILVLNVLVYKVTNNFGGTYSYQNSLKIIEKGRVSDEL